MRDINRRTFLANAAASGALFAIKGKPSDSVNKLIPYVIPPEVIRPGKWTHIATTCRECPAGCGMYVRHRDSRIIKCEGNPDHPISKGGLCPRGQSAPQGLYDPDRIRYPSLVIDNQLKAISWKEALSRIRTSLSQKDNSLSVITDLQTGILSSIMQSCLHSFGSSRFLIYEPFNFEPLKSAHEALYEIPQIPRYQLDGFEFILSLGADFLETWISPVEQAWQFSEFRAKNLSQSTTNKFVYIGPRFSMTAANADEFIRVEPGNERWVAFSILKSMLNMNLVKKNADVIKKVVDQLGEPPTISNKILSSQKINRIAQEFASSQSIALAAPTAARNSTVARDTAFAAALLNFISGGNSFDFSRFHAFGKTATEEQTTLFLNQITDKDTVIIHNSNIVFTRPDAAEHLRRARSVIYLSVIPDETAKYAHLLLPIDSPLESWGDYEPYSGIYSFMQPAMARVVKSRSAGDIFIDLCRGIKASPFADNDTFRSVFFKHLSQLRDTLQPDSDLTSLLRKGFLITNPSPLISSLHFSGYKYSEAKEPVAKNRFNLWTWPSIMYYDGRLSNRGWLQETPDPVSNAVWSSWAELHPQTAELFNLKQGNNIKITSENAFIELPVRISDEIDPSSLAVMIGQGHNSPWLRVAKGIGANPFEIIQRNSDTFFGVVSINKTDNKEMIVYTSTTRHQYDRNILKHITLSDFRKGAINQDEINYPLKEGYSPQRDLYPGHPHRKHRWAMVIDLNRCIGCGACTTACYAENNIPVVGRIQVDNGREMAWLKVVPYFLSTNKPFLSWIPMLCQHCDAAPCEPVCPVFAAVHNEEGLNAQIYNRCIGTRYCSNNCPYKVRRFNWFDHNWTKPLDLQLNPEVTVRCRGVMEKCTFCVQRIRDAEYQALSEHRPVRDGEIQPACVQSCPTKVFTFGDLLDFNSKVNRLIRCDPRKYQVLKELNTKTAVIYLKKVVIE